MNMYTPFFVSSLRSSQMMELRCIPFLHDEANPKMANETCGSVMFKAVTVRPKETVGNLRVMLEDRNAHYSAFPIISPTGSLTGEDSVTLPEERSDELRWRVCGTPAPNTDTSVTYVAAANPLSIRSLQASSTASFLLGS